MSQSVVLFRYQIHATEVMRRLHCNRAETVVHVFYSVGESVGRVWLFVRVTFKPLLDVCFTAEVLLQFHPVFLFRLVWFLAIWKTLVLFEWIIAEKLFQGFLFRFVDSEHLFYIYRAGQIFSLKYLETALNLFTLLSSEICWIEGTQLLGRWDKL